MFPSHWSDDSACGFTQEIFTAGSCLLLSAITLADGSWHLALGTWHLAAGSCSLHVPANKTSNVDET